MPELKLKDNAVSPVLTIPPSGWAHASDARPTGRESEWSGRPPYTDSMAAGETRAGFEHSHRDRQAKPRMGQISFINALPIVVPLVRGKVELDAELFYAEPGHLNNALDAGIVDLSAVSAFHYLNRSHITLVPGVSISSRAEVGSVLLYSKRDLSELDGEQLAVPDTSQTSVALLRILLAESYSVRPNIIPVTAPNPYDQTFAAACLFGDQALQFDFKYRDGKSSDLLRVDLGSWWYRLTGLPMVFAVWAARDAWVSGHCEAFEGISSALARSAALGLGEMLPEIVAQAGKHLALPETELVKYYEDQLCFELGDPQLESLKTFKQLCQAHRLLGD